MAAGYPYFAWIDPSETTFNSGHLRWDESIFSFKLSQQEGDPASLTIAVRRPRNATGDPIGLLGPGRKIWCWFALDCGPALIRFRGRLIGVPTSLFQDLVTLEFVAKPIDTVTQKNSLADSLRVLPYYDEAVIDPLRRDDPDVVLEGYTKIWHYDRETHLITVSDEITGEDGTVVFDDTTDTGKVFYDGLGLQLTSGPLARVDVNAEFTWTQQARGIVDLTQAIVGGWPGSHNGIITSYALWASDWPKSGAGLGDGWTVESASASDLIDYTVKNFTSTNTLTIQMPLLIGMGGDMVGGTTSTQTTTENIAYVGANPSTGLSGAVILSDEIRIQYSEGDSDIGDPADPLAPKETYASSFSRNIQATRGFYCVQEIKPTLVAAYSANRQCTERVSFSLFANVQPISTDPADGEALLINDIRSVNLTEGTSPPMGNSGGRSYIATSRGNQSLQHLIAYARAHLMKRARVVEITFAPKLERMPEITLRKNASLTEPRVGSALGKIINYSVALDGSDGTIKCEIQIGCAIGRGGTVTASPGGPTYCSISYCGPDYQQFTGRTILAFSGDASVAYGPPSAAPNDDGINFGHFNNAADAIEIPLSVKFGPNKTGSPDAPDPSALPGHAAVKTNSFSPKEDLLASRQEASKIVLQQYEVTGTFKLKSMTRSFTTDYVIAMSDLQIPMGYNLETV